jgi:hypothetical protein
VSGAPLARLELQCGVAGTVHELSGAATLEEPAPVKDSWHFHGRERLLVEA